MTNPDTIIFLHIPKTAGTTFNRILSQQYDSNQIFFLGYPKYGFIQDYQDLEIEEKELFRVVAGHTAYGFHEFVPGPSTYITILRDPVDRVVSFYNFVKNNDQHYLNLAMDEFDGIKSFIDSGITPMLDNGQTRFISGVWFEPRFGEITEQIFEQAKTNLSQNFAVVGLMEQFDATLLLLQETYNWQNTKYLRQNISKIAPHKRKLTSEEREVVLNVNQWDVALYEYAESLFKQQIAALDFSFSARVKSFQCQNSLYQAAKLTQSTIKRVSRFSIRAFFRRGESS